MREFARVSLVECEKTFRKLRTYIGFAALGAIVPILLLALRLSHADRSGEITHVPAISGFVVMGSLVNGLLLVRVVLMALFVHVPFLVTIVAGDQIAGEAAGGTLRLLLIRPPSRLTVSTAKFLVSLLYCLLLVLFLGAITVGVGTLLFGRGPLLLSGGGIRIVPEAEGAVRVLLALLLGALAMATVSGLAFLLSVLVTNPIGPIIGTMAILIVFLVISNTPLRLFEVIRPYLFTSYTGVWMRAFEATLDWSAIAREAAVLAAYTAGFYALAAGIFLRKDITT